MEALANIKDKAAALRVFSHRQRYRVTRRVVGMLGHAVLPGFSGANLWSVGRLLLADLRRPTFVISASAMAYNFFLALFPALIFLFSVVPFIPVPGLEEEARKALQLALPPNAFSLIEGTLRDLFAFQSLTLLLVSVGTVVFLALRGIRTMLRACQLIEGSFHVTAFRINLISIGMFGVLSLFFFLALVVLIAGEIALGVFADVLGLTTGLQRFGVAALQFGAELLLLVAAVTYVYRRVPGVRHQWRYLSPGSLLASVLLVLALEALGWYFGAFANFNRIYGSLGAVIILMTWFYYLSLVLLFGFDLDASITEAAAQHGRARVPRARSRHQQRKRSNVLQKQAPATPA